MALSKSLFAYSKHFYSVVFVRLFDGRGRGGGVGRRQADEEVSGRVGKKMEQWGGNDVILNHNYVIMMMKHHVR